MHVVLRHASEQAPSPDKVKTGVTTTEIKRRRRRRRQRRRRRWKDVRTIACRHEIAPSLSPRRSPPRPPPPPTLPVAINSLLHRRVSVCRSISPACDRRYRRPRPLHNIDNTARSAEHINRSAAATTVLTLSRAPSMRSIYTALSQKQPTVAGVRCVCILEY